MEPIYFLVIIGLITMGLVLFSIAVAIQIEILTKKVHALERKLNSAQHRYHDPTGYVEPHDTGH